MEYDRYSFRQAGKPVMQSLIRRIDNKGHLPGIEYIILRIKQTVMIGFVLIPTGRERIDPFRMVLRPGPGKETGGQQGCI